MEMETPEAPQARNNKIFICPILTVWIFFLLSLINFESYIRMNSLLDIIYLLFALLLLIIGILITIAIVKGKYKLYLIGLIITIIYSIIQIFLTIYYIYNSDESIYFFSNLILLLIFLIPLIVLLLYRKKVQDNSQDTEVFRNINIDLQGGNNQLIQ